MINAFQFASFLLHSEERLSQVDPHEQPGYRQLPQVGQSPRRRPRQAGNRAGPHRGVRDVWQLKGLDLQRHQVGGQSQRLRPQELVLPVVRQQAVGAAARVVQLQQVGLDPR